MNVSTISENDSILESIKKLLGIDVANTDFDVDILMHINAVFADLHQMGAGPANGFSITSATENWAQFSLDEILLNLARPYIYLKVKIAFDPPSSSTTIASFERLISEFEWRINLNCELKKGAVQNG